ncbi:MAG: acyl carrier protein [Ruminococcus sp.]|nr:acyl carrier protein [Ruminococcus sp.]
MAMVFDKIRDIIVDQLDVDADEVTAEASIIDDLGADSLDVVDLISSVEDEFDVEIPDEKVEGIKTVGDIVAYIESATAEE